MSGQVELRASELGRRLALLHCPACGVPLVLQAEQLACGHCDRTWPVQDGIPRFVPPGEHAEPQFPSLLERIREENWRAVVERTFAHDRKLLTIFLSRQRLPWLPLLLPKSDAVVLEIGCGWGATTESLARAVGTVYGLEPASERIEFTRIRLEQENISNVQLIQANPGENYFPSESFALIVVNGIENLSARDPVRKSLTQQLSFLHGLLKQGGWLVLGARNLLGHRILPWPQELQHPDAYHRSYRTYAHAHPGYRGVFEKSGFKSAFFYWADPSSATPHYLVPLEEPSVGEHLLQKLGEPSQATRNRLFWRAKRVFALSGMLAHFVPEFLIFAQRGNVASPEDRFWRLIASAQLAPAEITNPRLEIAARPFSEKIQVRVIESGEQVPRLFINVSPSAVGGVEQLGGEHRWLQAVSSYLGEKPAADFKVPRLLGSFGAGSWQYAVQSAASGYPLSRFVVFESPLRRLPFLQKLLPRCVRVSAQLLHILQHLAQTNQPVHGARKILAEIPPAESQRVPFSAEYEQVIQHGDFTVENILFDPVSDKLVVVDWNQVISGVPPLYDIFSLLVSLLPVVATRQKSLEQKHLGPLEAQFLAAFFGQGRWPQLYRDIILMLCETLSIPREHVWSMFLQFLALRSHPPAPMPEVHRNLLELALERQEQFFFPSSDPR